MNFPLVTNKLNIRVVFMGDSITEGQYVSSHLCWTDLLAQELSRDFSDGGRINCDFHNRGISGETTRQGLERFPHDVQEMRPDVMTLQFGLNDCNCWDTDRGLPRVSEAAYRANLMEMIARARRFGVGRIILSTNHPTLRKRVMASGETLEQRRVRYNKIVREVAIVTGVTLCDIEAHFGAFDEAVRAAHLLPEPDLLHLSPLGHRHYANSIKQMVSEAIRAVSDQQALKT